MIKELEALQDLSKLVFVYGGVEQYKIIETALKEKEQTDMLLEQFGLSNIQNFIDNLKIVAREQKSLKALEIIKKLPQEEKQVLLNAVYTYTKSEEKYNLLKEVLL